MMIKKVGYFSTLRNPTNRDCSFNQKHWHWSHCDGDPAPTIHSLLRLYPNGSVSCAENLSTLLHNHYHNCRAQPRWVNEISKFFRENPREMEYPSTLSVLFFLNRAVSINCSAPRNHPFLWFLHRQNSTKKSEQSFLSSDSTSLEKSPSQSRKLIWVMISEYLRIISKSTTINQQGKGNTFGYLGMENLTEPSWHLRCTERLELMIIPWPRL